MRVRVRFQPGSANSKRISEERRPKTQLNVTVYIKRGDFNVSPLSQGLQIHSEKWWMGRFFIMTSDIPLPSLLNASICKLEITQWSSINLWHCNHKLIPTSHCHNCSCIYPNLFGTDAFFLDHWNVLQIQTKTMGSAPGRASKARSWSKYFFLVL